MTYKSPKTRVTEFFSPVAKAVKRIVNTPKEIYKKLEERERVKQEKSPYERYRVGTEIYRRLKK